MKTVRYHHYGDPTVLRYEDVDLPAPAAGQVLIRVAGSTFNPIDAALRAGYLRNVFPLQLPHTPGIDVSGVIAALGEGVNGFKVGEPVVALLPGTENGSAAEYVIAPHEILARAPTRVALADSAALPSSGLSAWQALFELAGLEAGQQLLIHGAGGGVGGFAVQLAKRAGAYVIATARARNTETVRSQGADEVIDYTARKLADAVEGPLDAVLSLVTAPEAEMAALAPLVASGGVIVTTASAAPGDPSRDVRSGSLFVRSDASQLAALVASVEAGDLHLNVTAEYPLSDLVHVHELGQNRRFSGKVVIRPQN
jgi:NADPH:quinone reductase-like Zn-dependent oxidoreductase